jgi:hypothetical protein
LLTTDPPLQCYGETRALSPRFLKRKKLLQCLRAEWAAWIVQAETTNDPRHRVKDNFKAREYKFQLSDTLKGTPFIMRFRDIEWGPVFVTAGPHKGRIGELDDEDSGYGIVYFGSIIRHFTNADIPLRSLRRVTTEDLMNRSEEISRMITLGAPRLI